MRAPFFVGESSNSTHEKIRVTQERGVLAVAKRDDMGYEYRDTLEEIEEFRGEFCGTFVRFGEKSGFNGPEITVLLKDVRDANGKLMAGHLWFNLTKRFKELNMKPGDVISFHARVKCYVKGYHGWNEQKRFMNPPRYDYKLSHPTKVKRKEIDGKSILKLAKETGTVRPIEPSNIER